jgi:hypothetical protein
MSSEMPPHPATRSRFVVVWLLLGALAAAVCSVTLPQARLGDEYLPVGVDAFYHARRILDTAADPSAFYEFDPKIHAPEGSLLTWPWGYDYAIASVLRLIVKLGIVDEPMRALVWIPVFAVFVSAGLLMLVARRIGLSLWSTALAGACLALSPLTQYLHGVGQIDHHYAEFIFLLATLACGLKWLSNPAQRGAAILLGIVLGIAPAIHNGMFVLQVPVLASIFVLWTQNVRLPVRATVGFAVALFLSTLAILIPSLPFRTGHFEFYTLSWFHLYIAGSTAAVSLGLAYLDRSWRSVAIMAGAAVVLLLPLAQQVLVARAFLAGTIERLDGIAEMRSIEFMTRGAYGRREISQSYSLLVWLLPFTVAYCAFMAWQERATGRIFFWLSCIGGAALLWTQLRLQYFGSFALYLPLLVLAERMVAAHAQQRKAIMLCASLALLMAYWLPVRHQLLLQPVLVGDDNFRSLRPILGDLQKACADEPGVVLSDNDSGHYIRYYTQCSVIANNFLLTRQHEDKIRLMDHLTSLSAAALPQEAPYVRYVLLRPLSIVRSPGKVNYKSYSSQSPRLITELLLAPVAQLPSRYKLIEQANIRSSEEAESVPYIRLLKVLPSEQTAAPPQSVAESRR